MPSSTLVYAANLTETPRFITQAGAKKSMTVAATTSVADQMRLAIVLVGLPARGKTFTAAKLTQYLRYCGHSTKHFNVGKYRRLMHGANQSPEFFRADNHECNEMRNELASLAMEDMIAWMEEEGGEVGIFDATNTTKARRNMITKMAEGRCKVVFLETISNDAHTIERNIRKKVQESPDYAGMVDFEDRLRDFKKRLENYEKVYETVEEEEGCSYIKMIDMGNGPGEEIQLHGVNGYLPEKILAFLVDTHLLL